MHPRYLLVLLLVAGASSVGGCGPPLYPDHHYASVPEMPPEPYDEEITAPPGDGYTWVSGYWYWDGATYSWQRGRWASPPSAGHVWVRSGWVYYNGRYSFVRGYWAPPRHVVHYQYVRPAPRLIVNQPRYRAVPGRRR